MSVDPAAHVLDSVVWSSLTGAHAHLAEGGDRARRYPVDVSPFAAVIPHPDAQAWDQLRELVGPGELVRLPGVDGAPSGSWGVVQRGLGVQLVATDELQSGPDSEAAPLGATDVPQMLALVARTRPGPFLPRTYLLGSYVGIRREGALIAMAGERMHPAGYTEISAVCTDVAFQRQGLAARLVRAVADGIRARGETPFLHATATNENAIRLYLAMGFQLRRQIMFTTLRTPA
jgi:ribosomal protein S18 acetylase RimI-like enzyme